MSVDAWQSADPYEVFMGRWSRETAREFLGWLAAPSNQRWLDVGCGTGALSSLILEQAAPAEILAVDPSAGFIRSAQQMLYDNRVTFKVGDALALPVENASFDVTVSGLALNFMPDTGAALTEMTRVTCDGGRVAAYVWDYAGKMEMLRYFWDAARAIDPSAEELDEGHRFPLCRPSALERVFHQAGLCDIKILAIDVPTIFRDFDDYWTPFLGGQGPAPSYVASISVGARQVLENQLRSTLPAEARGSIRLIARAWAVQGRRRTG